MPTAIAGSDQASRLVLRRRPSQMLVVVGALLLSASAFAYAGGLANPDLRGTVRGDREAEVVLKLTEGGERVVFQARDLKFICDDQTGRRTFNPVGTRVRRDGKFEFDQFAAFGDDPGPDQQFFWVKGRILPRDRAKGFVLATYDPWDPPGSENLPECSTFGKLRWRASRAN
jgi:hypothetical protein